MYLVGKPLRTSEELQRAMDQSITVAVFQNGKMIDKGGRVELQTEQAVKINGNYFLKTTCEFKTR